MTKTRIRDVDRFVGRIVLCWSRRQEKKKKQSEISRAGKDDGFCHMLRDLNRLINHFFSYCPCGGPTLDSLIKLSKYDLRHRIIQRRAILDKFVMMSSPVIAPNNVLPHTASTSSAKEKPIEFYDELQIRARQQLDVIGKIPLRNLG